MNNTNDTGQRPVFFVSDRTGITAETLGATLLTQFDERQFRQSTLPFINSADKARQALEYIEHTGRTLGTRPIVFSTTVSDEVREILREGNVVFLDLFDAFVPQLEAALEAKSSHQMGRAHGIADQAVYESRIEAMNFALTHDDGVGENGYAKAEVILMAPSRCGKTPVCIYMAMQHGIFAANYPLTEDEFESRHLPLALAPHRDKLYGLYIGADRLHRSAASAAGAASMRPWARSATSCVRRSRSTSAIVSPSWKRPIARSKRWLRSSCKTAGCAGARSRHGAQL